MVTPEAVAAWLRLPLPTADADILQSVCDSTNAYVNGLQWVMDYAAVAVPLGTWPATADQGALMMAARMYRRRNSPAGVEAMSDTIAYTLRADPELERMLRVGAYQIPAVG